MTASQLDAQDFSPGVQNLAFIFYVCALPGRFVAFILVFTEDEKPIKMTYIYGTTCTLFWSMDNGLFSSHNRSVLESFIIVIPESFSPKKLYLFVSLKSRFCLPPAFTIKKIEKKKDNLTTVIVNYDLPGFIIRSEADTIITSSYIKDLIAPFFEPEWGTQLLF